MGKKRKTGKKEGVLLVLLVLFCTFLTGCDLLDIKDGGLGMTNPDYVEPEEESTTSDHTEPQDLEESQKEDTISRLTEAGDNLYVVCNGADSPGPFKLRNKLSAGQCFLWEQKLLTGSRIQKEADPWA